MSNTTFIYHTDPGHGWLQVPLSIIAELGIAKDISTYSYTDGRCAYLEEDCDAGVFFRAFEEKHGAPPESVTQYKENTPIRNLPPFTGRITA